MWTSRRKRYWTQAGLSSATSEQRPNLPHLKRVLARMQCDRRIFDGRVLLNDVSEHGLRIFSSMPLDPGSRVSLTLFEPRTLALNAVVEARHAPMRQGHIVSARSYSHRLVLRFLFSSEDERRAVAEFVAELREVYGIRSTAPVGAVEFPSPFV